MAADRKASEAKVIEEIRRRLPALTNPGASVTVTALDPETWEADGAFFSVAMSVPDPAFVCRRGGDR